MKQISILGCGWLGLPLAKSLLEKGFSIKGSTTSEAKISALNDVEIDGFQIEIAAKEIKGDIDSFLKNSEILIIDIPPKLRGIAAENFVEKIKKLIPFIEKSAIAKVIFVSSTAVYSDDTAIVIESTKPQPYTESGRQLLEAEILLQNNSSFKTTVVRFGGLIGEDRHPITFLSGRQKLEIELDCWNTTFNAVAPFHPARKEYYTQKAIELGLPLPEFAATTTSFGKIINSTMIELELDYKFKNTSL
jgi:nucleoside-diphosphate-sugar epimerase